MDVNDILSLNYEPFVRHFMNQASGKTPKTNSKNNLVVVRAKKEANPKTSDASVNLVSPVSLNIDQAKLAVKNAPKEHSIIPPEISEFAELSTPRQKKRKAKSTQKKKTQKRRKVLKDIFSKTK